MDPKFCRNCLHHFRDKHIFAFYTEIQDGRQKWQENNVWETVANDSMNTLGLKNFVKISLSCTVSKISTFLHFTQKFNMASQMVGKLFWQKVAGACTHALWLKNLAEIARSLIVYKKYTILHFIQKFKMSTKNGGEMILGKNCI